MTSLPLAVADSKVLALPFSVANRHGLIAGATGTGKTVTLRVLAEGFASQGIPVFLADVKGDLSGLVNANGTPEKMAERAAKLGQSYSPHGNKVAFWDVFGEQGLNFRTTISDVGPLLLARMLDLNATQEGVLSVVFRYADDQGLLLLDLNDLRAVLTNVAENAKALSVQYGAVSGASIAAIQRALLSLESQGGDKFFGEPALELADLMRPGTINVLSSDKLIRSPKLYATVLLWLLAELFEELPEVGDAAKPKLVFFFDEAHLLFDGSPKVLVDQVEQVVRLIRSKGVGVYFVSQSPLDIPEDVLGQLGHRVQHALRAFTPKDQKSVRAVAQSFRPNPNLDTARTVQELAVGEALVSFLDEKGVPSIVERAFVLPPASQLPPLDPAQKSAIIAGDNLTAHYSRHIDRHSAMEELASRANRKQPEAEPAREASSPWSQGDEPMYRRTGSVPTTGRASSTRAKPAAAPKRQPQSTTDKLLGSLGTSVARNVGSQLGRQIVRGILGVIFKK